jgi:hypothetical protein
VDVLGIGIGGSGIKGAPMDLKTGDLLEERIRIPTTQAPTSEAVVETSLDLIGRFGRDGPVRVGFPGVIKGSMVHTAATVGKELSGFDVQERLQREAENTVREQEGGQVCPDVEDSREDRAGPDDEHSRNSRRHAGARSFSAVRAAGCGTRVAQGPRAVSRKRGRLFRVC